MEIFLHGGNCCGIKTIAYLSESPDETHHQKKETSKDYLSADRDGGSHPADYNFFWEAAPTETGGERFDRMIAYLERVRHFGLVEVALAVNTDYCSDSLHGYTVEQLEAGEIQSFEEAVDLALVNEDEWGDSDFEEGGYSRYHLQDEWVPFIEERGFREVSRFPNINSGNMVAVFHLIMDGDYYKNKKKEKK